MGKKNSNDRSKRGKDMESNATPVVNPVENQDDILERELAGRKAELTKGEKRMP